MFNRIFFFILTNVAVMAVFGIITRVFGLNQILGLDTQTSHLLVFSALMGFVGSFISLALSKTMAKRQMGVKIIENPRDPNEAWILQTVHSQARRKGLGLPEVGIFQSPQPNAFATGMNKNKALVAVSTGLLQSMSKNEVEAVLGHEVAHVANGDMVTMGLLQGVMNTFVFFFSYLLGNLIDSLLSGDNDDRGYRRSIGYYIGTMVGNVVFGFLAGIVTSWFSRRREFRADQGGADLAGRQGMIDALKALQRGSSAGGGLPDKMAAFGISSSKMASLFSTHPPLEKRIQALEAGR